MKMYQLNCPACGATVEIEQDRKSMFCSYCGSKIYLDDGVKRVEITKKINYHQTYTDEAKIREHERKEKIQLKQLEYEEREKKRNDRVVFACMGIMFLIAAICFGISRFYEEAGKPDANEVQVPFSSKDLKGENYEQVIIDLENAITNINQKLSEIFEEISLLQEVLTEILLPNNEGGVNHV